jgi:hypothetical protein
MVFSADAVIPARVAPGLGRWLPVGSAPVEMGLFIEDMMPLIGTLCCTAGYAKNHTFAYDFSFVQLDGVL